MIKSFKIESLRVSIKASEIFSIFAFRFLLVMIMTLKDRPNFTVFTNYYFRYQKLQNEANPNVSEMAKKFIIGTEKLSLEINTFYFVYICSI